VEKQIKFRQSLIHLMFDTWYQVLPTVTPHSDSMHDKILPTFISNVLHKISYNPSTKSTYQKT